MKAPPVRLDTPAALINLATRVFGRISRLAIHSTPDMRLRVMGELALTDRVLDQAEHEVILIAQHTLKALAKPPALPPARRATPQRTS